MAPDEGRLDWPLMTNVPIHEFPDEFADLLDLQKQYHGLTLSELARRLKPHVRGIDHTVLARWRTGERMPHREDLDSVADAMNLDEAQRDRLKTSLRYSLRLKECLEDRLPIQEAREVAQAYCRTYKRTWVALPAALRSFLEHGPGPSSALTVTNLTQVAQHYSIHASTHNGELCAHRLHIDPGRSDLLSFPAIAAIYGACQVVVTGTGRFACSISTVQGQEAISVYALESFKKLCHEVAAQQPYFYSEEISGGCTAFGDIDANAIDENDARYILSRLVYVTSYECNEVGSGQFFAYLGIRTLGDVDSRSSWLPIGNQSSTKIRRQSLSEVLRRLLALK